jgi:hypothetical protein
MLYDFKYPMISCDMYPAIFTVMYLPKLSTAFLVYTFNTFSHRNIYHTFLRDLLHVVNTPLRNDEAYIVCTLDPHRFRDNYNLNNILNPE